MRNSLERSVSVSTLRIPAAIAWGSSGSTNKAASPRTSGRAARPEATTGVPQAIASIGGRPNPSSNEGTPVPERVCTASEALHWILAYRDYPIVGFTKLGTRRRTGADHHQPDIVEVALHAVVRLQHSGLVLPAVRGCESQQKACVGVHTVRLLIRPPFRNVSSMLLYTTRIR